MESDNVDQRQPENRQGGGAVQADTVSVVAALWSLGQGGTVNKEMKGGIPSPSLTWNLKMAPWNRRFLLDTIIFKFHVKLGSGRWSLDVLNLLTPSLTTGCFCEHTRNIAPHWPLKMTPILPQCSAHRAKKLWIHETRSNNYIVIFVNFMNGLRYI